MSTSSCRRKKSTFWAYVFWLFGGWFGLHHFYLGRDRQAFVWWCLVAGYGGVGWLGDLFRIPRYVQEANFGADYLEQLALTMKQNPKPKFSLYRFLGQIVFGNLLAWVTYRAIPVEEVIPGFSLAWLSVLIPLGSAIGVHCVGNIGREQGPLTPCLIGAYIPYLFYTASNPHYYWSTVLAAFAFRNKVNWRRSPPKQTRLCTRLTVLITCGLLYTSLWCSYVYFNLTIENEHGETIKFRDSVNNLLKSPLFVDLKDSLNRLYQYWRIHGWAYIWHEFITQLDPLGERNALKALGLSRGSTQEEIQKKWRELSKQWHPDRYRDPEEKLEAQRKFMEIKEAYDKISVINARRKLRNTRVQTPTETESNRTEL